MFTTPYCSSELRETVNSLLEEKKNFVCQIHEQQRRIEELTSQVRTRSRHCCRSDQIYDYENMTACKTSWECN